MRKPHGQEISMAKGFHRIWSPRILCVVVLSFGIDSTALQSSFAGGCEGYCKARQVRAICHEAVKVKGLDSRQRDVEFERCKSDPLTHRRVQELADETGQDFE
jgi:hypothetical protein